MGVPREWSGSEGIAIGVEWFSLVPREWSASVGVPKERMKPERVQCHVIGVVE